MYRWQFLLINILVGDLWEYTLLVKCWHSCSSEATHFFIIKKWMCWICLLLAVYTDAACFLRSLILMSSESREFRGRHVETCPPLSLKGNKWKNPRESHLWNSCPPLCLEDTEQRQCWLGQADAEPWNTAFATGFLKSAADPFVSSSGSDDSIKGFTGLHDHQIHKAPHGKHYWDEPKVHEILSWRILEGFKF